MSKNIVIAKSYDGEPLVREAVGIRGHLIYVVNPSAKSSIGSQGVGFPKKAVFEYESTMLAKLESAYAARDSERLDELWASSVPARIEFAA